MNIKYEDKELILNEETSKLFQDLEISNYDSEIHEDLFLFQGRNEVNWNKLKGLQS